MNFKRFHESKNLFNESNFTLIQVTSTAYRYGTSVGVLPQGTYTFNATKSAGAQSIYLTEKLNGVYSQTTISSVPFSFTADGDSEYIIRTANNTGTTWEAENYLDMMLNTGSQPLPYEPYDTEVWHDIPHYIHTTSTDTITTLPAVLYPNAVTATVGLKGNMEQSGTPSPTTPIQPSECGDLTGNLFDGALLSGFYKNASFGLDTSGGTVYKSIKVYLVAGTYTVSFEHNVNIVRQILDGIYSENIGSNIDSYTFTTTTDTYFGISFRLSQSSSTSWDNSNIMLNTGSQPLPYEPYGVKIPILSGGTTTPVYLGEVESTRKIKKLVLTGQETIRLQSINEYNIANFYINIDSVAINALSSHLERQNTIISQTQTEGFLLSVSGAITTLYMRISTSRASTTTEMQTWLSNQYTNGTPVTFWHTTEDTTTGIVNEPIRKIGDYADEVSGISIPVTAGANTLSVDTTLQPSEVTVNYKGWHPVQSVHEYGGAGNNIFDFANPNIANGYIANDEYCPYPTNAMIYVPIVQGIRYVASGIKRYNQDLLIRWATLNVANPNTKTAVMRTGQFNQTEKFTITAESGETYIYFMFCGDSDYTAYGSVQNAYNANCPDVIVAEQEWD